MPTAIPDTQMMTSESTPSLKSSFRKTRARTGVVQRARTMAPAKRAMPPSSSTNWTVVRPTVSIGLRITSSLANGSRRPSGGPLLGGPRGGLDGGGVDLVGEEGPHARVRMLAQRRRRPLDGLAAGQEQDDVIGDAAGRAHVMRHHDHGDAVLAVDALE